MAEFHFSRYRKEAKFTHLLLRFPAKFHSPVARRLLEEFSSEGDVVLDPFCGSGTVLVEAVLSGRNAIGVDVDPLATFISRVKSKPINPMHLERCYKLLHTRLEKLRRSAHAYDKLMFSDISDDTVRRSCKNLAVPAIPNIQLWFRNYVIVDLARIRQSILRLRQPSAVRNFFLACFASVIRNASNADPVPVSGLEVTSHMICLDIDGRRIDPFHLFHAKVVKELAGMRELWEERTNVKIYVRSGDASNLASVVKPRSVDVVITSPPYNTAVDYYRRHMLEMYWLGLVKTPEQRIELATKYIGRTQIRKTNKRLKVPIDSGYVGRLIASAGKVSPASERMVRHYCSSMIEMFAGVAEVLKPNGKAVFVVGNSKWNGRNVRTTKLLAELAGLHFRVEQVLTYSSKNRYMSYSRHNGANVNREYILVFRHLKRAKKEATAKRRVPR